MIERLRESFRIPIHPVATQSNFSAMPHARHLPKHLCGVVCLGLAASVLTGCREKARANIPSSAAIPVRVDAVAGISRGGRPYFVKGAGGSNNLEQLAARGANSIRTWDTTGLDDILDHAGSLGLTVSAGIWLESECSWFSYENPAQCQKQIERVRGQVTRCRDHPALLAWGLGNESEGDGTNSAYWRQIDRLALLVREIDPAHPTYTSVAGLSQAKAACMDAHAPHLDYVGINTYGGVISLRQHLEKIGWKRPWLLTEWGPRGFWESPKSSSGAPLEQTSTEKAEMMQKVYQASISSSGGCLGSYVFVWGWKYEATATWFGLYTHDGDTTAGADTLQELWTGTTPANQAPAVMDLSGVPKSSVRPGGSFDASVQASDPDGDPLVWHWAVLPEQSSGSAKKRTRMPAPIPRAITHSSGSQTSVQAPETPGIYRLYVWIKDSKGHAATANTPFEVR